MDSSDPSNIHVTAEIEHLNRLEAVVRRGLDADVEVGLALAEISDTRLYLHTHQTFEAYLRDRWSIGWRTGYQLIQAAELAGPPSTEAEVPAPATATATTEPARALTAVRRDESEALAKAWERARSEFCDDEVTAVDITVTVRKRHRSPESGATPSTKSRRPAEVEGGTPLPQLRRLMTQSSGTIADAVHQVELHGPDLDHDARALLRDDVRVVEEELEMLKLLLLAPADWDAEYDRLLSGEIPPFDDGDADDEDEDDENA